jgi:hypothetical protein
MTGTNITIFTTVTITANMDAIDVIYSVGFEGDLFDLTHLGLMIISITHGVVLVREFSPNFLEQVLLIVQVLKIKSQNVFCSSLHERILSSFGRILVFFSEIRRFFIT